MSAEIHVWTREEKHQMKVVAEHILGVLTHELEEVQAALVLKAIVAEFVRETGCRLEEIESYSDDGERIL